MLYKEIVVRIEYLSLHIPQMILERLGSIIQGQQDSVDSNVLYTVGFESRHFARVRGVMSAITRPASVASLIAKYNFQEKLFFSE